MAKVDLPELFCFNCKVKKTASWRRNKSADILCNACYIYEVKRGISRPYKDMLKMKSKNQKQKLISKR